MEDLDLEILNFICEIFNNASQNSELIDQIRINYLCYKKRNTDYIGGN